MVILSVTCGTGDLILSHFGSLLASPPGFGFVIVSVIDFVAYGTGGGGGDGAGGDIDVAHKTMA